MRSSARVRRRRSSGRSPRVSPTASTCETPTCLVPRAAMGSLSAHPVTPGAGFPVRSTADTFPGHPGPDERSRPFPWGSPASKPRSSCESVHDGPGCPGTAGRCSPGVSSPLKPSPPTPGSLGPVREAEASRTPPCFPLALGAGAARRAASRTCDRDLAIRPPTPGPGGPARATPKNHSLDPSTDSSSPWRAGPGHLSVAILLPWPWSKRTHRSAPAPIPTFGVSQYAGSRISSPNESERRLLLWGFSPSRRPRDPPRDEPEGQGRPRGSWLMGSLEV